MLQALLHRKLDESIPEPQRLEDALTSTVFGMLVWVDAWDLLTRWLDLESHPASTHRTAVRECWFWPRLAFAEPDVVLRIGATLVVVEAKYQSGRHDLSAENDIEEDLCDQLVRQHRCVTTPRGSRPTYVGALEHAIDECSVTQAFVVDARRRRARREFEQSKARLPAGSRLTLVSWRRLFRLLNEDVVGGQRWAKDLRAYLELCNLDTFGGIGRSVQAAELMLQVPLWRAQRRWTGFREAVRTIIDNVNVSAVRQWHSRNASVVRRSRVRPLHELVVDETAAQAILRWNAGGG